MKFFDQGPKVHALPIDECTVPECDFPPLLLDIVSVWGSFAGITPKAAAAVLVTVTGGIVGSRVSIDAPFVGDLAPSLQLTVVRDRVPLLRRAIQRMLLAVEGQIIHWLHPYEHLSDRRAQNNELASLETRLNALLIRREALAKVTGNEKEMRNAFFKQQETQILAEEEAVVAEVKSLQDLVRALRFRIKSMMMVPSFGYEEFCAMDGCSFDRAILEVSISPGYFERLARLPVRAQEHLASFRRNSDWATRLEFVGGSYRPRSSVSSIILATKDEIKAAYADRVLMSSQVISQNLVCDPAGKSLSLPSRPDPGVAWSEHVGRLFRRRLEGETMRFQFSPKAKAEFEAFLSEHTEAYFHSDWQEQLESFPATVAKVALCVRLLRDDEEPVVSLSDLTIAIWIAKDLLATTREVVLQREKTVPTPGFDWLLDPTAEPDESPLDVMVGKLRRLGPCTRRTLFRAYSKQDYEQLVPILDRLITLGWVEKNGKNYQVAEAVPSSRPVNSDTPSVKTLGE